MRKIILILLLSSIFSSCSIIDQQLVKFSELLLGGTWERENQDIKESITFFNDGTALFVDSGDTPSEYSGRYLIYMTDTGIDITGDFIGKEFLIVFDFEFETGKERHFYASFHDELTLNLITENNSYVFIKEQGE